MALRGFVDQNVASNLARDPNRSWHTTRLGTVIRRLVDGGRLSIEVSVDNILEVLTTGRFNADGTLNQGDNTLVALRRRIADTYREMSADTIAPPVEYLVVRELFDWLKHFDALCTLSDAYIEGERARQQGVARQLLYDLSVNEAHENPFLVSRVLRGKYTTELLHSVRAKSPDRFVKNLLSQGGRVSHSVGDPWAAYDRFTFAEIESRIEKNKESAERLSKVSKNRLMKNRHAISARYAAAEAPCLIENFFRVPQNVLTCFDVNRIVHMWPSIEKASGAQDRLPDEVTAASFADRAANGEIALRAVEHVASRLAFQRLSTMSHSTYFMLHEIERAFALGKLPTSGYAMDANHAMVLTWADVVISSDARFRTAAERSRDRNVLVVGGAHEKLLETGVMRRT